jgi:hypothetical protein
MVGWSVLAEIRAFASKVFLIRAEARGSARRGCHENRVQAFGFGFEAG